MPVQFYTNGGSGEIAELVRQDVLQGLIRLFKSGFAPTVSTTLAEFDAQQCDFTNYPDGGEQFLEWHAPILDPLGGYGISSSIVQFFMLAPVTVTNLVGGWYFVLPAVVGPPAKPERVFAFGLFDVPVPMQLPGQGLPISLRFVYGN